MTNGESKSTATGGRNLGKKPGMQAHAEATMVAGTGSRGKEANPTTLDLGPVLPELARLIAAQLGNRQPGCCAGTVQRLLTVSQAAQYLGRTTASLQHLIAAGKVPTIRSDRRVLLDIQELDRWIAENKKHGI
jgi:excisionase family DNA binding protein